MIRCSDLALALLLATPVGADPLVSDAFGLYDPAMATDRAAWSGLSGTRTIAPGPPDRIIILAGPKSLVAGKDPGHVVAIIIDRSGNLVAENTSATLTIAGTRHAVPTEHGIAHRLIQPGTRAGHIFAGATAGERQSPKAMLDVVANLGSIQPQVTGPLTTLGGETVFEITSPPLADRFGNPIPDGTGGTILLSHGDGSHSLAFGQALGDRLQAQFIARDIPGAALATLTLGADTSAPEPLSIAAPTPAGRPALAVEPFPAIAALRLTLGPFLTTDGYALTDGAEVSLSAQLDDGSSLTDSAYALDGSISLLLPLAEPERVIRLDVRSPLGPIDLTEDWHTATRTGATP